VVVGERRALVHHGGTEATEKNGFLENRETTILQKIPSIEKKLEADCFCLSSVSPTDKK
jgi:hypothetical protein